MKLRRLSQSFLVIFAIGIFSIVSVVQAQKAESNDNSADPNIVVVMKGLATPVSEPRQPDAQCLKGDLFNAVTDRKIGTAMDCFDNFVFIGDGFYMDRTTYFNFPQGELVARGVTTMQPVLAGSPSVTHLSGDIPDEGDNNILSGTKRFQNASGRVRLSGAAALLANGDVLFNCIFIIDLD
jgi:hypothetical protein